MTTQFEKIYVLSLTIDYRRDFIKEEFKDLGLDFEFIYGTDFANFTKDGSGHDIIFPYVFDNNTDNTGCNFGCTITHYQAVLQAYELGYNNVLIMEDDICFIKDKELISNMLNSIPSDANFVTYDPRFINKHIVDEQSLFIDELKKSSSNYVYLSNNYKYMCGGMMYGIMDRSSMELYLANQRQNLNMSDRVIGFWKNPVVQRYVASKCICTDHYNIGKKFNSEYSFYENLYHKIKPMSVNLFYNPKYYSFFTRQ